jgi:hypothetical protein
MGKLAGRFPISDVGEFGRDISMFLGTRLLQTSANSKSHDKKMAVRNIFVCHFPGFPFSIAITGQFGRRAKIDKRGFG